MTTRAELLDAVEWCCRARDNAQGVAKTRYAALAWAGYRQLDAMPADPIWAVWITDADGTQARESYQSRGTAALAASNALSRGAVKVEIVEG
jgi:hypothetical protein